MRFVVEVKQREMVREANKRVARGEKIKGAADDGFLVAANVRFRKRGPDNTRPAQPDLFLHAAVSGRLFSNKATQSLTKNE